MAQINRLWSKTRNLVAAIRSVPRLIVIDYGAFFGGIIGAIIGAIGTIFAGYYAWLGVQDQIREQRLSSLIAQRSIVSAEISYNKKLFFLSLDAYGNCNVIRNSQFFKGHKEKNYYEIMLDMTEGKNLAILKKTLGIHESKIVEEIYIETRNGTRLRNVYRNLYHLLALFDPDTEIFIGESDLKQIYETLNETLPNLEIMCEETRQEAQSYKIRYDNNLYLYDKLGEDIPFK